MTTITKENIMKSTIINPGILGGQGSIGAVPMVSNPAPSIAGPASGDSTLSTQVNVGTASTNTGNLAPKNGTLVPGGIQ